MGLQHVSTERTVWRTFLRTHGRQITLKHRLTDKFLLSAKPIAGADRTEYFDANVAGLSVIVSANTKTFYQHFSDPLTGKRQRLKIGRYGDITLASAREKVRAGRTEVAEGKSPTGRASRLRSWDDGFRSHREFHRSSRYRQTVGQGNRATLA
jgi:hypothetical protein